MERTSTGNTRMVTIENLQLGTMYQVRVRAVSDLGDGAWSDTISRTTLNGMHTTIYIYFDEQRSLLCMYISKLI